MAPKALELIWRVVDIAWSQKVRLPKNRGALGILALLLLILGEIVLGVAESELESSEAAEARRSQEEAEFEELPAIKEVDRSLNHDALTKSVNTDVINK